MTWTAFAILAMFPKVTEIVAPELRTPFGIMTQVEREEIMLMMLKNTIRDGGSIALYTIYTVYTVNTVSIT